MKYRRIGLFMAAVLTVSLITNAEAKADSQGDCGLRSSEFVSSYYADINIDTNTTPIIESLDVKSFTYPENKIGTRDNIAIDTKASGGSGQGYLYNYNISRNGESLADLQDNENSYFEFRPAASGQYKIEVTVKDKASAMAISESKAVYFNVVDALYEDINLDGIVDLYDLTDVSKRMNYDKSSSSEWYSRWNQSESDDVIDIRDLALVAQAYNSKFDMTQNTNGSMSYSQNEVITYSMSFLGTPYQWGATGPSSFDTSGFIMFVYKHFGINLPRTSYDQSKLGVPVKKEDLEPGDLIFFGTSLANHVGIYIGNDCYIHAPQTGDVVKISPLTRTDILVIRRLF